MWASLLTFLGGPRACIGYRFSLIECVLVLALPRSDCQQLADTVPHRMKAIIYTLVRAFEFELAIPPEDLIKRSSIVQRPVLRNAREQGSQMPLLLKRYKRV